MKQIHVLAHPLESQYYSSPIFYSCSFVVINTGVPKCVKIMEPTKWLWHHFQALFKICLPSEEEYIVCNLSNFPKNDKKSPDCSNLCQPRLVWYRHGCRWWHRAEKKVFAVWGPVLKAGNLISRRGVLIIHLTANHPTSYSIVMQRGLNGFHFWGLVAGDFITKDTE